MERPETTLNKRMIDLPPVHNFRNMDRAEGRLIYKESNLLVSWDKVVNGDFLASDDPEVIKFIDSMRSLGWAPFSEFLILHTLDYLIDRDKLSIPYEGEYKKSKELQDNPQLRRQVGKVRRSFYEGLLSKLDIVASDGRVVITEKRSDGDLDLTPFVSEGAKERSDRVENLASYDSFMGYTTEYFKGFVAKNRPLLVFLANSNPDIKSPTIAVNEVGEAIGTIDRNTDLLIGNSANIYLRALRTTLEYSHLKALQQTLKVGVDQDSIKVATVFKRSGWIRYGFMEYIKSVVEKNVGVFINDNNITCDPLDAQYQVLFRLTSFRISELFDEGEELAKYCGERTNKLGWRGLLDLDEQVYRQYQLSPELLNIVLEEQMTLITNRLSQSNLPIADIVTKSGIFQEDGWEIKKDKGQVMAVKRGPDGSIVDSRSIDFREINTDIAMQFHADLHYIHTPRCNKAFGFYLEDEELPFSVLGVEPVDRMYKRNTLLLFGYDPRNCLDFTRLYSKPGVPKNVSSAIFGETFSYIRHHDPKIEAAISSFMPSYASGLSMLTGGFETPILIKPGVHYFAPTQVNGRVHMEHLTKRRQQGAIDIVASKFPLLPVIELISPLKSPRFEPVLKLGEEMVEL